MKIIIGADIVPTESNKELFINGDISTLLGDELYTCIANADYRIFNLEVPFTNKKNPIKKCGPNLIAETSTVNGYKALGCNLLTLANNHIMDQGVEGLKSTVSILRKKDISFVGAGESLEQAIKPVIVTLENKKIGIYACVEHEFGIATRTVPGANPFDVIDSYKHVEKLKRNCDYVIVLYHGGKEHYRYPSPNLQKYCRNFVDFGANLVLCQHSHCIGCEEVYNDGKIVYGQGNFLFDLKDTDYWKTGLLIEVSDDFKINYIPVIKENNLVRLAEKKEANKILDLFYKRSAEITDIENVERKYKEFCKDFIVQYLSIMTGKETIVFKCLNKLLKNKMRKIRVKHRFKAKELLALLNHVECEAHNELLITGIKETLLNYEEK